MPKGKRTPAHLKAQIVLEALREDKTVAQLAAEYHVHPNQIHKWKKQALEQFNQLFEDQRVSTRARDAEHERELHDLYAEVGRLTTQLSWLKKKSGLKPE